MHATEADILSIVGNQTTVIYDGECPFCSRYVRWARLRANVGPVALINARDLRPGELSVIQRGYDLDQGMIFVHDGRIYWGADAIHAMSLLSGTGVFTKISAAIFRRRILATLLYPVLRLGRNIAIRLRGRGNIHRAL